mgnify:FL=1
MNKTLTLQIAAGIASALLVTNVQSHMFTNFPVYDRGGLYKKKKGNRMALLPRWRFRSHPVQCTARLQP